MANCCVCETNDSIRGTATCNRVGCKADRANWLQCPVCEKWFRVGKRGRGALPKFCGDVCRALHKKAYHKKYDARPDQLKRRRKYMKEVYVPKNRMTEALEKIGVDELDRD